MPTKTKKGTSRPPAKSKSTSKPRAPKLQLVRQPALVPNVCALTDPFCEHAYGAKYPDDSSVRSLTQTVHQLYNVVSNPSGLAATFFTPSYGAAIGHPTCTPGIVPEYVVNSSVSNPYALTGVKEYRITSWGVRLKAIGAPLYRSGVVHIRFYRESSWLATDIQGTKYNGEQSLDIPVADCLDVQLIGQHSAAPPANFYLKDNVGTLTQWDSPGYNCIGVYIDGVRADETILQVEVIAHYELLFGEGTSLGPLGTPPPPANPLVTQAASLVSSTASNIFTAGARQVAKSLEQAAINALQGIGRRAVRAGTLALMA